MSPSESGATMPRSRAIASRQAERKLVLLPEAGVGYFDDRNCSAAIPKIDGCLCLCAESHDGLQGGSSNLVDQPVTPLDMGGIGKDIFAFPEGAGEESIDKCIHAYIRPGKSQLGEKALHPLTGVSHQRASGNPLGRPRV